MALKSLASKASSKAARTSYVESRRSQRYASPAPSTCLAREALLLRQLRYSTGQRAPACFYTPYRAYLAAAGTRTYAPPPPQPRGTPSACSVTIDPSGSISIRPLHSAGARVRPYRLLLYEYAT